MANEIRLSTKITITKTEKKNTAKYILHIKQTKKMTNVHKNTIKLKIENILKYL